MDNTADVAAAVEHLWKDTHPRLSREAERAAIQRAQAGDQAAALELLKSHMPLLKRYIRRVELTRNALVPEDARQVAVVGFMEAVRRFDPDRSRDLAAFVFGPVATALYEWGGQYYVLSVPQRTRERFDQYMRQAEGDVERARELWEAAGNDPLTFDAARRAVMHDVTTVSAADFDEDGFEHVEDRVVVSAALLVLTQQERSAVTLYFGLHDGVARGKAEVAERLGVSPATATRLRAAALAKMQQVTAAVEETA